MIPRVINPTQDLVGESSVLTAIDTLLTNAGWTSFASTNPYAGTRWYQSNGEDGLRNIVFGLAPATGVGQLRILVFGAADLNSFGVAAGTASATTVAGYSTEDNAASPFNAAGAGCGPQYLQCTPGSTSFNSGMCPRDAGTPIEYWAAANKNFLCVHLRYQANGAQARGFIYAGLRRSTLARNLWRSARARVQSIALFSGAVGAGTAVYTVTLDRNINNALKDGSLATDPFRSSLLFQSVATAGTDIAANSGFAMAERIQIATGSLGTDGSGRTTFRIGPVSAGRKLWATGKRYDKVTPLGQKAVNGVGDIVSVCSEAPVFYAASRNDGSTYNISTDQGGPAVCLSAWNNAGGQRAGGFNATAGANPSGTHLRAAPVNSGPASLALPVWSNDNDPSQSSNRAVPFGIYIRADNNTSHANTTLIPMSDYDSIESVDVLEDVVFAPKVSGVPDRAVGTINGDPTRRFRFNEYIAGQGMLSWHTVLGFGAAGTREYQFGIRGQWT